MVLDGLIPLATLVDFQTLFLVWGLMGLRGSPFFLYWETQLNGNSLGPSRKMTEITCWWRKHNGEGFFFFVVKFFFLVLD